MASFRARVPLPAIVVAGALAVVGTSCRRQPVAWTIDFLRVPSPAGPNSSEVQLTDSPQGPILSWVEQEGKTASLKFVERRASEWSAPITAASGDDWFLSAADVPGVMRLSNGTLVAQWGQMLDQFREAYNVQLSYSRDAGRTWTPPFLPHHDGTIFQHGFASLFELPGSTLGLVWLDGRNSEFLEEDPTSGTMTLRYAAYDASWTQVADTEIDHNVCECCQTTAVFTPDGALTAYRDRTDDEVRDIAVSRLDQNGWTTPGIVHQDGWNINACPVNGPMLAARGRNVVIAWYTAKNNQGQSYAAFSTDAGRTWGQPIRLDDSGSLGRVDVEMLDDGSAVASWIEFTGQRSEFRVRRIERSGERSAAIAVAAVGDGRVNGFPRIGRRGDELIAAWSESAGGEGERRVQTAVARLP